jgi:hypothetical protein
MNRLKLNGFINQINLFTNPFTNVILRIVQFVAFDLEVFFID